VTVPACFGVSTSVRNGIALLALLVAPVTVSAQPPPEVTWRVAAGYETFTFRDVATSKPPVNGSPVAWKGSGPVVSVDYARARPLRLHRFQFTTSSNGNFAYETGVSVVARDSKDAATFIEGNYDYRRYFARTLGVDGLHAGIGVRGMGERRVLQHHFSGDVTHHETDVTGSIAIVAALRLRRSDRFGAEVEWANAATLAHGDLELVADATSDKAGWGAGWITDLTVRADVRVASHLAVVVFYIGRGEGLLFDLRSYSDGRRRIMAGVTYAR